MKTKADDILTDIEESQARLRKKEMLFASMRTEMEEQRVNEKVHVVVEADEYEEDDELLNKVMQDMQDYDALCKESKSDETRILLEVLEAQQNRTDEEWLLGGGINNEEVMQRLKEVWAEEDRQIAEAL